MSIKDTLAIPYYAYGDNQAACEAFAELRKADHMITELSSKLDRFQWISVKDRMPPMRPTSPTSATVLFFDGESVWHGSYWPEGYSTAGSDKPHWANDEGVIIDDEGDVTHWMPLPEAPTK